jgi:hypothetical protein
MSENIFGASTPVVTDATDSDQEINLGTLFKAGIVGTIAGARWFAPTAPLSGGFLPTVTLYRFDSNAAGTVLAQKQMASVTLGAWNTLLFNAPVAILGDPQWYVMAILTNRYTATAHYFDGDVVSGNLTGLAGGAGRDNGRFTYNPTPAYPTSSFNNGGYFIDPLFDAGVPGDVTGAVDFPISVGLTVAGRADVRGAAALPLSVGLNEAGRVDVRGAFSLPVSVALNVTPAVDRVAPGIHTARASSATHTARTSGPNLTARAAP